MSIKIRVFNVLNRVTSSKINMNETICLAPLTSKEIGLSAVDFAYFVMELSEEFNIVFVKEDFVDYKFNTIDSIVKIVEEKIKL